MTQQYLVIIGISLVVAGVALALISIALLLRTGRFKGSGGAIILLGPIPIVLGSDKRMTLILLGLGLLLIIIFLIAAYV